MKQRYHRQLDHKPCQKQWLFTDFEYSRDGAKAAPALVESMNEDAALEQRPRRHGARQVS